MRGALIIGALALFATQSQAQDICAGISPASASPLTSVRIASGLNIPLFVTAPPGDTERLFIVEQNGTIRIWRHGQAPPYPVFLDVSGITRSPADGGGNEEGLLGLAFHPNYATNGWFFIYHTDSTGANNVVARYARSSANPDVANTGSRLPVISFAHPGQTNHNGGMIAFGPDDGMLYIGTGDGGGSCDASNNAQTVTSNLGKLLRINVNNLPYSVPSDNPFVGRAGNDEIWASGLRNPWRWSFDRANADLYIGDVGQSTWEEVNYRPGTSAGGENYGWDKYEGNHCPNPSCGSSDCNVSGYVAPVTEYQHSGGACSVTGGYVYRGCRMPALAGRYFYGEYCAAWIKSFVMQGGSVTDPRDHTTELAPGGGMSIGEITSFGQDARGEIYIVDRGGEVFKILPVLRNLEVSGPGAAQFQITDTVWSWEDLARTSEHPITSYKVYRSLGPGSGQFDCIHQSP
ncbi:MAG: PQQ-dependent sugar dehydrogenase, partial [Acidobacteria bacterium]|nr:PQQ-dependent sugar dehydrogenase [Acidobacteriota bacterium]